jgi:hypothetical protein
MEQLQHLQEAYAWLLPLIIILVIWEAIWKLIAMWKAARGIRRNIGSHLTYEAGLGFGYQHILYKSVGFSENEGELAVNLHLRVGYRF